MNGWPEGKPGQIAALDAHGVPVWIDPPRRLRMNEAMIERVMRETGTNGYPEDLVRFAAAIRAAALEEAAKACEDVDEPAWFGYECPNTFNDGKAAGAAAIRALMVGGEGFEPPTSSV